MISDRYQKKLIAIVSLFVLVAIVGIAYAVFTGQLNINGSGVTKESCFSVYFDNLSNGLTTGTARIVSSPEIKPNKTIIEDYKVNLITPGDSVSFTFDIVNDGDYDVSLTNLTLGPAKLSVNGNENDPSAQNLSNYITYKLYNNDTNQEINVNTSLKSKDVMHLKLVIKYLDNIPSSKLPSSNVDVSNLGVELVFEQTSIAKTDGSGKILPKELMSVPVKPTTGNEEFLSTSVPRRKIYTLNIVNNKEISNGYQSSDCSEEQNGTVMCWWKESTEESGYYDMYIGSDGKVFAPANSENLFRYVGYDKMKKLDLGSYFDTSHVTNMKFMFYKTGGLAMTSLDLGDYFDTSNVDNMYAMFYSASTTTGNNDPSNSSITSINLGNKFNTSNVTDMAYMFANLYSLGSLDLGNKFDTSKVTDMNTMFQRVGSEGSLSSLNLGNKFDTSKVTNMNAMFNYTGANNMTTLDLGNKFSTAKASNLYAMFNRTGYYSLQVLNLGTFGVNHDEVSNPTYMLDEIGYANNTLQQVIVKNQDVADWLNGLDNTAVPAYVKNKIAINN